MRCEKLLPLRNRHEQRRVDQGAQIDGQGDQEKPLGHPPSQRAPGAAVNTVERA